jgi:hypothetical protein
MAKNNTKLGNLPPPQGSLLMIFLSFDPKTPNRFEFDMGEREMAAIGYATVHWAFMEEVLYTRTALLARRAKVQIPAAANDLSFSRRIRAFRLLVRATIKDQAVKERWNNLIARIAKENGIRQKIVHGLWSYDARKPHRLFSRPRRSLGTWATSFSAETLYEFGARVGSISYELLYPKGSKGARERIAARGFSPITRSMQLRMLGQADGLGFPQLVPTKSTHPLAPSLESILEKPKPKDR